MATRETRIPFEASANLQRLIGRELVPNEEAAVIELAKNAYDSGARKVTITIQPGGEKQNSSIEVRDDGLGMTLDDVRRLFLVAGYSERPDQIDKTSRVPTGEKGIGRFAADKLGKRLNVLTKTRNTATGIEIAIDWEDFKNKRKKFQDITAICRSGPIPAFGEKNGGTILSITRLRAEWHRSKIESLRKALSELLDPFHKPVDFEIELQIIGSERFSGPVSPAAPDRADIEIDFKVLRDGRVQRRSSKTTFEGKSKEVETLPSSSVSAALPSLSGRFAYFLKRPSKTVSKGLSGAVRLYRDGFRVEPFVSQTADWLGVSEQRAKRAGHAHIVPSRLFGFVEISRREHPDLNDTTSRQALLNEDAARGLVTFLKEQLRFLEQKIRTEITEPRWKESRKRQVVEFEQARLQTLGIMSYGLAHELRQPLQSIRSEAQNITTRLQQLNVKDQDIEEAQSSIDAGIERIDKTIGLLSDISRGNSDEVAKFDLVNIIQEECRLFRARCAAQDIKLTLNLPTKQEAHFNRIAVSQILLNLLQNAIDAHEDVRDGRGAQITVALSKQGRFHQIEVVDNALGIPDEIKSKIFKKFATQKTGGMGVGLYYCHSILNAWGGELSFISRANVGTTFTARFPDGGT